MKTSFIRPWERNSNSFPQLAPPTTDLLSLLALGSNARFLASWRSLRFSYYHSGLESLLQSEKKEARDDEDCNTVCTYNQLPVSVYVRCSGWARRFLPPSLCPSSKKPVLASFFPHSLFFLQNGWGRMGTSGPRRKKKREGEDGAEEGKLAATSCFFSRPKEGLPHILVPCSRCRNTEEEEGRTPINAVFSPRALAPPQSSLGKTMHYLLKTFFT